MKEAPTIFQYWHSAQTPDDIAILTSSFREQNPEMRHLLVDEAGAESFIAKHLTEREVAAFRACAVPAMQADYFRYCAVLTLGGICADVDCRCVGGLGSLLERGSGGVLFERANNVFANGFFAFRSPDHPLLRLALEVATANIERRVQNSVWVTTGPWIFTALAQLLKFGPVAARRRAAAVHQIDPRASELLLSIVDDHARLEDAFASVRIEPYAASRDWIHAPEIPPAYKDSPEHWISWQKAEVDIFR